MSNDLRLLDEEVESFARRRDLELTDDTRDLLRDAMLAAKDEMAAQAIEWVSSEEDENGRERNKSQRAAYRAVADFVDLQRAWIDRVRAEAGLPERPGKQIDDALVAGSGPR